MEPVHLSQATSSAGPTTILSLLVGVICTWLFFHLKARTASTSPLPAHNSCPSSARQRSVQLKRIEFDKDATDTDIDIIAIHGLDTTSRDTWTWKDPRDARNEEKWVNWLQHPGMLPESVDRARIFTCDWPADLVEPSDLVQRSIDEYALLLLDGIQRALFGNEARREDRPIAFIASCLGGIILLKALVHADDERSRYYCLRKAARGVVFLATPFRGTSFPDIAAWAELGLKTKAFTQGRQVSKLLESVKGSTFDLDTDVRKFTQLCQDRNNPCEVFNFYERGTTSLPHKVFPWLPAWFDQRKQLVDRTSATLDIIPDPLDLDRRHSLMNKFSSAECPDYKKVVDKIREIVGKIRKGTPLQQADAWIRNEHYSQGKLQIERLSGDLLSMNQCYINLAIVEQAADTLDPSYISQPSPFSLFTRQKIETPDATYHVDLATIFNPRQRNGRAIHPRRILIRGRAGVGKTTLCKKAVFDFTNGTGTELHHSWTQLFDRLLWIPLRRLKQWRDESFNLGKLFQKVYFSQHNDGRRLADALWNAAHRDGDRTLFILDGLDEVSEEWNRGDDMFNFLETLLGQPNVVITSRPNASLPPGLKALDLELETIGFYPDQVREYIKKSFTPSSHLNIASEEINAKDDDGKVDKIQAFLQTHWLIQGLVRIPIQLDALCYTWHEDFHPETMTQLYSAIELSLWKKDIDRPGKGPRRTRNVRARSEIERWVKREMRLVEFLAFSGLYSDVIDFKSTHRDIIYRHFNHAEAASLFDDVSFDDTLTQLSFLRTSDPSLEQRHTSYHFIHLTFQEYFAARYFVRQWTSQGAELNCLKLNKEDSQPTQPSSFLQEHKYTARYDIFWRFVAGLLDAEGRSSDFLKALEQEPLDLLGPTHQRLVMHCLSEVSLEKTPLRQRLEEHMKRWLLFECIFQRWAYLSSEMEFPEQALRHALREGSDDAKMRILKSLERRPVIPPSVNEQALSWLRGNMCSLLKYRVLKVLSISTDLPDNVLGEVAQRLFDGDKDVQLATLDVLQKQSSLSDEIIGVVMQRLKDEEWAYRGRALEVLQKQSSLSNDMLEVIVQRVNDGDFAVREAAINVLQKQSSIPHDIVGAVAQRLNDEEEWLVRQAALEVLQKQSSLSNDTLWVVIQRLNGEHQAVRQAALEVLQKQSSLSHDILGAIAQRLTNDEYPSVHKAALEAIETQSSIYDDVLGAVKQLLDENTDLRVRLVALDVLQKQSGLSDSTLEAIVQQLDNEAWRIRQAALEILQKQPSVSDDILGSVVQRLQDEVWSVRDAALKVFEKQPGLSDNLFGAVVQGLQEHSEMRRIVVKRLGNKDSEARQPSVWVLGNQSSLSDDDLWAIKQRLDDENSEIRQAALWSLQKQPSLSDDILGAVVRRLDDGAWRTQQAAEKVLEYQTSLSDDVLEAIKQRLVDDDVDRRYNALEVLRKRPNLSDNVLRAIVRRLDDDDDDLRYNALDILRQRSSLSNDVLGAVIRRLDDGSWQLRKTALEILQEQSSLSDDILEVVVQLLDDDSPAYPSIRRAALKVLQKQSSLSDNILTAVAALQDCEIARNFAEVVLRRHGIFYSTLSSGPSMGLFKVLFRGAFEEQWSWYIDNESHCVNMPDGITRARIDNIEEFMDMVQNSRPQEAPPTAA